MGEFNNIDAKSLIIGENVQVHPTASIRGLNGPAENITLGDNVYIGANVQIICDDFSIGDYSKIQHDTNIHGYKPCKIGHNAWIGQFVIIDCIGGVVVGNNCGIGAHSQLWSHIKYGDTLEGCRFLGEKKLEIGNDVWFVGHCIVSPIHAQDKSMAMVGSVITKDMHYNQIYAGSPAKNISEKIGDQFQDVSIEEKFEKMNIYLEQFQAIYQKEHNIKIVLNNIDVKIDDDFTYFVIESRLYKKTKSAAEMAFMKFLLPDKAKFIPFLK
jgi:acetyltransferase-like isoleucine patch superfamily enzyme